MLIDLLKSILYGIIEGITEWLPISSTGHLILTKDLIPFQSMSDSTEFFEMFKVVIQLGAIMAVVILFWNKLWPFQAKRNNNQSILKMETMTLWFKVLVATVPAGIVGLILNKYLDDNSTVVAIALIVYGFLFIIVERFNKKRRPKITSLNHITYRTAFIMGAFQMLALIPGTSRSGATILGAILIGISRPVAAEMSFFMAIPIMAAASLYKIYDYRDSFSGSKVGILLLGSIVSFVVSLVAISFLMNYIKKKDFSFFGYYRIALGIIVLLSMVLIK